MTTSNIDVVKSTYGLFASGELNRILDALTDDIVIDSSPGAPHGGRYIGKEQVLELLKKETTLVAIIAFELQSFFADGDEVVCFLRAAGTVHATGKSYDLDCVHRFRIANGKVASLREWVSDSRQLAAAFATA